MKRFPTLSMMVFAVLALASCKNADYKTTASGMKYIIFDGGSKDSTKVGDVLKMNFSQKLEGAKDTVFADTYGKMPLFQKIQDMAAMPGQDEYGNPTSLFKQLKKGDSLVVSIFVDSLIKKGMFTLKADSVFMQGQYMPFMKKADKILMTFKVLDVFKNDSLANLDYQKEMVKDEPRRKKEQEEMVEKMRKEEQAAEAAEEAALEKSGEKAKQVQEVANYLAAKKITATKTALGTFVKIDNPGTGAQAADGKFVTVKYLGKTVTKDSTFDSGQFTMQLGKGGSVRGFEDGLKQFKQGGKGVIYIPGYLAYGNKQGTPFKPYEPLYFNVEILGVSDTDPTPAAQPQAPAAHSKGDGHNH